MKLMGGAGGKENSQLRPNEIIPPPTRPWEGENHGENPAKI